MERNAIAYIAELAAKPGNQAVNAPWYCIASCAFAGCNQGIMVPHVYRAAIAPFQQDPGARRLILRRIKESLINGAFVYGDPRLLNAFYPLVDAIPDEESIDKMVVRKDIKNPYEKTERGEVYMNRIFGGPDMDRFLATMDDYWPDLRKLVVNYVYGLYQSERSVLDDLMTSRVTLASLTTMDVPKQLSWHIRGCINIGGTREIVQEVLSIAQNIIRITEVELKNPIPDIDTTIATERLV